VAVFTVYNCGTAYHRNSPDVIAYMNKVTTTPHFINDGVGSGDLFDPFSTGVGHGNPGGAHTWSGLAFGAGIEANVTAGIAAIKAQIKLDAATFRGHKPLPPIVNMAGWSRGAVTCYKIANTMSRDAELKSIPVNIFAIDPVPGSSGVGNKEMWQDLELTPNVSNCTVIIAWHDSRRAFAPVITPRNRVPAGCTYTVYIMPGNHSSIVEEKAGVVEAAQIVKDMAMRFLRKFHTHFTDKFQLSAGEIIEKYAIIAKNFGSYQELAGRYFTSRIIVTQDSKGKSIDSMKLTPERKEGQFFINDHHKELYLELYPKLFHELVLPAHLAFGKARYKGGWGKEMEGMIAAGYTESAAAILRYGQSIGADCTPPRPVR
jgi:hypothetical protein